MVTKLDTAIGLLKSARNTLEDLRAETPTGDTWFDCIDAVDLVEQALALLGE